MLSVASEAKNYQLIIPEVVDDFEQMLTWWYRDEAKYDKWIPRPDDIFTEEVGNYTQPIVDIFAQSQAIADGEMVDDVVPDGVWEVLVTEIADNYEWWYPRMRGDILAYLDSHHYFYDAFEYGGAKRVVGDYRNAPLQEVW